MLGNERGKLLPTGATFDDILKSQTNYTPSTLRPLH